MEHAMLIGEEVHRLFVYCILLMNECFCCVLLLKVLQVELASCTVMVVYVIRIVAYRRIANSMGLVVVG